VIRNAGGDLATHLDLNGSPIYHVVSCYNGSHQRLISSIFVVCIMVTAWTQAAEQARFCTQAYLPGYGCACPFLR
jgi:hypothetical protein